MSQTLPPTPAHKAATEISDRYLVYGNDDANCALMQDIEAAVIAGERRGEAVKVAASAEPAKALLARWWDEGVFSWEYEERHEAELAELLRQAEQSGAKQSLAERVRVEGLASVLYEVCKQTDDVLIRHHVKLAADRAHYLEGAKS